MRTHPLSWGLSVLLAAALAACGGGSNNKSTDTPVTTTPTPVVPSSASGTGELSTKMPLTTGVATPYQFNVTITSADGTPIVATVFVPAIAPGAAVPLLLHSHGFGGSRVTSLDFDEAAQTSEINQDVMQMAYNVKNPVAGRAGWYVISYDQRGHGESGGQVNIMDPALEGADYKAVLNWAEQNLPHLAYRQKDGKPDPVIGSIGRSYGGAFQLMGMGVDGRVDAILPGGTWYDLRYSLNPGGVAKSTYLNGLVGLGAQSNRGRYPDFIVQGLVEANSTGMVNDNTVAILGAHGTVAYCDGGRTSSANGLSMQRSVPAFFVQGLRDVLFNINESIANYECYHRANPAAKMLFTVYGHSLDGIGLQATPQVKGGKYAFNESRIWLKTEAAACPAAQYEADTGRCVINVKDLMFQFLVEHLLGMEQALSTTYLGKSPGPFPTMTAVLDNNSDNPTAIELPKIGSNNRVAVPGNTALSAVSASQMVTASAASPTGLDGTQASPLAALGQVAYFPIPLPEANVPGKCLVGTPQVLLNVSNPLPTPSVAQTDPVLFAGLAVNTTLNGTTTRRLLHEQVTPLRGFGAKQFALPGISVKLAEGQALEVVVGGFSPVFVTSSSRVPSAVNVTAAASLPLPTVSSAECPSK